MTPILLATIILALAFDFLNGIHDSSNVVATIISSRAMTPRLALGATAVANFIGPFVFGVDIGDFITAVPCSQIISIEISESETA